ncbi:MAG: nucleotidyl transferase AbiEii/AbiGii toxin family protein [bacterium]
MKDSNLKESNNLYGFRDKELFEKTIKAVTLLSEVVRYFPEMIFKGGTSVLLRTGKLERLSIDIDIILDKKEESGLSEKLAMLSGKSKFFKSVEENRRQSLLDKMHFKFYYDSEFGKKDQYVLLDAVFMNNPYYKLEKKDLEKCEIVKGLKGFVNVPTAEGLYADKLVAISAKTLGIDYNNQKEMEYCKQLIDLGILFKEIEDVKDLRESFNRIVISENLFQKENFAIVDVKKDLENLAMNYCAYSLKSMSSISSDTKMINMGLKMLGNHLLNKYSVDEIKVIFSQVVYVLEMISDSKKKAIRKGYETSEIKNARLNDKYKILERLKRVNPDAYAYWYYAKGES